MKVLLIAISISAIVGTIIISLLQLFNEYNIISFIGGILFAYAFLIIMGLVERIEFY